MEMEPEKIISMKDIDFNKHKKNMDRVYKKLAEEKSKSLEKTGNVSNEAANASTPTPWTVGDNRLITSIGAIPVNNKEGNSVANVSDGNGGLNARLCEANAAFIVRAVNAHEELIEALGSLLKHEGERVVNGVGMESDSDALEAAKEKARAALAKAEGKGA